MIECFLEGKKEAKKNVFFLEEEEKRRRKIGTKKERKEKRGKKREREMSLSSSTTTLLANALLKRALMTTTTAGLTRGRSTIPSSASWGSSSSSHKGGGVGRRFDAHNVFFGSPLAEKRTVSSTRGTKSSAALSAAHQPSEEEDEHYMRLALKEAEKAFEAGEVPVGAVLVHKKDPNDQHVIARSHNTSESRNNPLAHAELECIDLGRKALGEWRRLKDSTLYVTLEPCAMCAGAILQARVGNVVYGARNPQLGAHGSWCGLLGTREGEEDKVQTLKTHAIMPEVNVRADVLGEECSELMKTFFKNRREQAKKERERLRLEEEKYRELLFKYDGVKKKEEM